MIRKLFIVIFSLLLLSSFVFSQESKAKTEFYLFYSPTCPHCKNVEQYVSTIEDKYDFNMVMVNVQDKRNQELFIKILKDFNSNNYGVPQLVINNKIIAGDKPIIASLEKELKYCQENGCELYGTVSEKPKASFTSIVLLALADSVNPCELAVLLILLSTVLIKGKRKDVLKYGLAFILTIIIMYFLMGTLLIFGLKLVNTILPIGIFYLIFATGAIILGLLNLKDAFFYGAGNFIMEVPRSWRPTMKSVLEKVTSIWSVIIIAIIVALFLLPCTAGPYFVVSGILANYVWQEVLLWLSLYNIIFVLPMIAVMFLVYFGVTTIDKIQRVKEKNVKTMHLIAALLLLLAGAYLLYLAIISF